MKTKETYVAIEYAFTCTSKRIKKEREGERQRDIQADRPTDR